ncbi:hypothetical protein STANM309S_03971 [Streptomyces tanashiensis]
MKVSGHRVSDGGRFEARSANQDTKDRSATLGMVRSGVTPASRAAKGSPWPR